MLDRITSDAIFKHQFEGFPGYPHGHDARYLEVFNQICVSVAHATATVEYFETFTADKPFPDLTDIRDTARNLRPKFEVQISDRERWEKQYGPARPFEAELKAKPEGREIDRLWREVLSFLRSTGFDGRGDIQRVHIGRCWQIAKHLGYPMNSYQQREIDDYERIYPQSRESLPVKTAPAETLRAITQAEFDRVKAAAGEAAHTEAGPPEATDDPNRWD